MATIGPIRYTILDEHGVVHVLVQGHLRAEHLLAYLQALGTDPEYRQGMNVLVDLQGVDPYDVDPATMRVVVSANAEFDRTSQPSRCALVSGEDFVYGMLRMFQLLSEGQNVEIAAHRDLGEAAAWVGLPLDDLPEG